MCQDLWQALVQNLGKSRETQRDEYPPGKLLVPQGGPPVSEWSSVMVLGDGISDGEGLRRDLPFSILLRLIWADQRTQTGGPGAGEGRGRVLPDQGHPRNHLSSPNRIMTHDTPIPS